MDNYSVHHNDIDIPLTPEDLNQLDLISTSNNTFHTLYKNKGYDITLLDADFPNKTCTLAVNGTTYTMHITDDYDHMVARMGLLAVEEERVDTITAPIPGLIIDITVTVGQEVKENDPLLVLSAMKMENIITAPNDGVIAAIDISLNEAVEKGKVLITFE